MEHEEVGKENNYEMFTVPLYPRSVLLYLIGLLLHLQSKNGENCNKPSVNYILSINSFQFQFSVSYYSNSLHTIYGSNNTNK